MEGGRIIGGLQIKQRILQKYKYKGSGFFWWAPIYNIYVYSIVLLLPGDNKKENI